MQDVQAEDGRICWKMPKSGEAGATMVKNDNHKTAIHYANDDQELIGMLHEVFGDSQE